MCSLYIYTPLRFVPHRNTTFPFREESKRIGIDGWVGGYLNRRKHRDYVRNVVRLFIFQLDTSIGGDSAYVGYDVAGTGYSDTCNLEGRTGVRVIEGLANEVLERLGSWYIHWRRYS